MLSEERNDRLQQILAPSHHVSMQVLAVVVMSTIHDHLTDSKMLSEFVQGADTALTLRDHELMEHLESDPAAVPVLPALLPEERD